jgi:hypothetical protein
MVFAAGVGSHANSSSDCGLSLSPTAGLIVGDSEGPVTQRCIRLRNVFGIQASCDSSEVAIMFIVLSILGGIALFRFNPAASTRLDMECVCGLPLLTPR